MLLLLFGGIATPFPPLPLDELVTTAPVATHGAPIQRPAESGVWRMALELADPAAALVGWHDITDFYAGDRHRMGSDDYMGRNRARLVDVQLQIDNNLADYLNVPTDILAPWGQDTSDLFGVNVPLDAGLLMRLALARVVSGVTVEWEPIWTGRVEVWGDASASRGQIRTHVVSVVDTIGDLANVPVLIEDTSEDWRDWFTDQLLPGAGWNFGVDIYGEQAVPTGLPFQPNVTAASTLMDAGTDPLGLTWRSLRSGRLVIHPWPWDTTNTERYPNPLLDVYPDGLKFAYSPDFTDIEYIADDDQQPFGIPANTAGVLNYFIVTMPDDEIVVDDDPVSIERYGVHPFQATWIISNPPVVDDLKAARAFASKQALPLRTSLDHEGFWSALAIVDHLDPVTVVHQTSDSGLVVTGTGWIRNVVEERTWRGDGLLSWQSTVQIDIASTDTTEALLPVEMLTFVGSESPPLTTTTSAEFSWVNPVQPSITPTHVQFRAIGRSLIWTTVDYPGVGADGVTEYWFNPATSYQFQVRLIRMVDGVVTNASPIRRVQFTTAARIYPIPEPGEDPTDTGGDFPPLDDDCPDFVVELQENDGSGWVTVDELSGSELTLGTDGHYHPTYDYPNSFFNEGSMYRFRSSCDGGDTWTVGPSFDPPDDWSDPCTEPPALSTAPYDDPSLLVYVPKVCAPDIIREAVSGIEAVKGDALLEIDALLGGDPNQRVLTAVSDPLWSDIGNGVLAYGECPQIIGATGDKTISVRVFNRDDTATSLLGECAGMRLSAVAVSGGGWRAVVTVYKPGLTITLPSASVLDVDTEYVITATFELATGDITLSIDGIPDNSVGSSDNVPTTTVLPIWSVGAPPDSWVTDFALWGSAVAPPFDPLSIAGCALWLDAADTGSISASGGGVTQWRDKSGNVRHMHDVAGSGARPTTGSRTQNGENVIDFSGSQGLGDVGGIAPFWFALGDNTMFVVYKMDADPVGGIGTIAYESSYALSNPEYGLRFTGAALTATVANNAGTTVNVAGADPTDGNPHFATWIDSLTVLSINQDAGSAATGGYTRAATTLNSFSVGMLYNNSFPAGGRFMDGWIAEVLIYDSVLSGGEISAVETYLTDKWGL